MCENTQEKRKLIWERISNPNTVQIDGLSQVKYTCEEMGEGKN